MNKGAKNVFYGLIGQTVILALGIVIPRFILKQYSDEANGLMNAITQIFTYLALIEAGIGQSALQALYKPVVQNDTDSVSAIMSATQRHYRKLVWLYAAAVMAFAFIYPLVISVEDVETISFCGSSYWAVFLLIFLQGLSGVISFYFAASYKQLFIADGQHYVISNITTINSIIVSLVKLVLISISVNIVFLQFAYLLINIAVALLYCYMFRKKYACVNLSAEPDKSALEQKNSFLVHEISSAVFSATDLFLISIFCDLRVASIYAIYNLVFSALNQLIGQVHNGCFYILGQNYNNNKKEYACIHDAYDTLYIALVFTFDTVAFLLINPFVRLYTSGVSQMNYVDTYLPILFTIIQLLSCCRITASNLVKIAGHANKTIFRSMAESCIHIIVSLVLVQFMGIYGVMIGTIIALLYRTNDFIVYSNCKILKRSPLRQYKIIGSFFALFIAIALIFKCINMSVSSYYEFLVVGIILVVVMAILYFGVALLLNAYVRRCVVNVLSNLIRKIRYSK